MPLELGERHAGGGKIATFPIVFTNDSKYVQELSVLSKTVRLFVEPPVLFKSFPLPRIRGQLVEE